MSCGDEGLLWKGLESREEKLGDTLLSPPPNPLVCSGSELITEHMTLWCSPPPPRDCCFPPSCLLLPLPPCHFLFPFLQSRLIPPLALGRVSDLGPVDGSGMVDVAGQGLTASTQTEC